MHLSVLRYSSLAKWDKLTYLEILVDDILGLVLELVPVCVCGPLEDVTGSVLSDHLAPWPPGVASNWRTVT